MPWCPANAARHTTSQKQAAKSAGGLGTPNDASNPFINLGISPKDKVKPSDIFGDNFGQTPRIFGQTIFCAFSGIVSNGAGNVNFDGPGSTLGTFGGHFGHLWRAIDTLFEDVESE